MFSSVDELENRGSKLGVLGISEKEKNDLVMNVVLKHYTKTNI